MTASQCCLDQHFGAKAQRLFSCTSDLWQDTAFLDMLRGWNNCARVTNMHIERLLARIRTSTGRVKTPTLDHMCAGGLLSSWLHDHLASGGKRPGVTRAADLIEQGVPLARNKVNGCQGKRRAACGQMLYAHLRIKESKRQRDSTLDRQEYRQLLSQYMREFRLVPSV